MSRESVESLVDRYIEEWDYTPKETAKQIKLYWEMEESEKKLALRWLYLRYNWKEK